MNFAVRNEGRRVYLCAGQESHCQMYIVNPRILTGDGREVINGNISYGSGDKRPAPENGLRSRGNIRNSESGSEEHNTTSVHNGHVDEKVGGQQDDKEQQKTAASQKAPHQDPNLQRLLKFDVKSADSVQTDFLETEPLQRVVRISANGSLMATGGTDGYLRIWSFPQMLQTMTLK